MDFNNLNSEQHLLLLWIIFSLFVGIAISIDLGIFGKIRLYSIKKKKKKENGSQNSNMLVSSIPPPSYLQSKKQMEKGIMQPQTFKQALIWTMVWISLAGVFAGIIYAGMGYDKLLAFVTGYTVEKSLSIDNMFVFLLIFSSLGIPPTYQHKVLSVGILSAIAMRIPLILVGVSLLEIFNWMVYIFGGLLLFTAIRMLIQKKEKKIVEIENNNIAVRILKKIIPVTLILKDNKFFSHQNGILYATPMLVALVIVEMTDLVFAIDSIPAILAITTDSFIIITSNIFAILGLRSLYLLIAGLMYKFYYLKPGLIALLFFIGFKMVLSEFYKIPLSVSLVIILGILTIAMVLSFIKTRQPYEKIRNK